MTEPVASPAGRTVRPGRTAAYAASALAAGLVVGLLVAPDADRLAPPPPALEPVVSTTLVCPDFRASQGVSSTTIVATVPSGVTEGKPKPGRAVLTPLRRGVPKPIAAINRSGGAATIASTTKSAGPIVGLGVGGLAPGFSAGQLTVVRSGSGRGLAGIDCADVTSEQWFVGAAAVSGSTASLILVNAEVTAATVQIDLVAQTGPVDAPGGQGVVVPARSTRVVALDALAPGKKLLAAHVRAEVGRVAMALRTSERAGSIPRGIDYVPPSAAPALRQVIPALPSGPGRRDLLVVVPGNDDADVRLKVLGASGSFSPIGVDRFTVGAGTLKRLDLSKLLEKEVSGLLIESDVPVVAGTRVQLAPAASGRRIDYAWSAAVPPITTTAVESYSKVGDGFFSWLVLTAADGDAQVTVQTGPPGRATTTRTVKVAQGTTSVLKLGVAGGNGRVVTILRALPGSSPVWAGRVQALRAADGSMLTIAPLRNARIDVEVPQAVPDLSAAVPKRD